MIKLCKAGLSDDLVISTINASPSAYDTSATGLAALKTGGASDKVIDAVLKKNSMAPVQTSFAKAAEASALPAAPSSAVSGMPRIFIEADADFAVALTAAMNKKHDPAVVVLDEKSAECGALSQGESIRAMPFWRECCWWPRCSPPSRSWLPSRPWTTSRCSSSSVLKLIKASLSDDLVITTINASPRTCDTSANGLVPATAPAAGGATFIGRQPAGGAAPAAAGAHRRPPEVGSVGVDYQDRTTNPAAPSATPSITPSK